MRLSLKPNQWLNLNRFDLNINQTIRGGVRWVYGTLFPLAWCICPHNYSNTHTHGVHTVAEKSRNFCLSGDVPLTISPNHTAPPLSPNNTFPFPASCILLSGIIHPSCLWSLSCSTHSGIGKLHNCTTHLTFIAPLSPGHFSGLTLPTGDQWDADFECFSGRSWVTGHYLTHPALTNIPVNHRMLGNSNCFFSVSFYPNIPRGCPSLRPVLRFPACMLVLWPPRQVHSGTPSER